MYAPEISSPRIDPANLPWMREQPHWAQLPTYTARPAWTYPLESAWSRLSKFQTLNCLSWQQLTEALSVLRTTNAECGIDLRASDAFDIPTLARTLRVPHADLQSAFCVQSNHEVILDAASQSLRFCQSCAETGFHATLFQFAAITYCPIHHRALRDTCFNCARSIPYRLDVALMQHPYACPTCATSLLAGPLHYQRCAALAPRTFDRLRPWHEYFAWCAGLVNLDSRRQRDISSGQYLSNDAIQRRSSAQDRLAFIGDLQRYLCNPPPVLRSDRVHIDALPRDLSGPPASAPHISGCVYARRWPNFDASCIALNTLYRRAKSAHLRRLMRQNVPATLSPGAFRQLPSRVLLIDGESAMLTVAMVGWRMSWERRFSLQTLTRCVRSYPPFGLLEWLAFMPACYQVPRDAAPNEALLQYFKSDLARTWNAWCLMAASMRNSGSYIASPLLLPTCALWIDPLDRSGTFLVPHFLSEKESTLLRDPPQPIVL
jgi:hypothetical protein